jgi:hypothetical protein
MNENNFKKLHAQRVFWRGNNKTALCWAYYCDNDNKEINVTNLQTMHYYFLSQESNIECKFKNSS